MTRQQYIDAVKVKIEEISPFDEPESFIADDDSSANTVKPIISYIDKSLDEAASNCLRSLPLSLLHRDIESTNLTGTAMHVTTDGVATFDIPVNVRPVRFQHSDLARDITTFITSESPLYLLQQNRHTRGGCSKPIAVISTEEVSSPNGSHIEIYSLSHRAEAEYDVNGKIYYINMEKKPGTDETPHVQSSSIEDLIVLECARMVFNILGNFEGAKVCENEQAAKIQAIPN